MANVIAELLDRQEIRQYLEGILDVEEESWVLTEIDTDAEGWIGSRPNAITINEIDSERCLIKYELWDDTPPSLETWDRSWSGSVRLMSGKIFAISQYGGGESQGEEFDLGRRDRVWSVRVHRKALSHEEFTAGIISFTLLKLQFWPSDKRFSEVD
jgi:hypothetical protein